MHRQLKLCPKPDSGQVQLHMPSVFHSSLRYQENTHYCGTDSEVEPARHGQIDSTATYLRCNRCDACTWNKVWGMGWGCLSICSFCSAETIWGVLVYCVVVRCRCWWTGRGELHNLQQGVGSPNRVEAAACSSLP